MSKPLKRVSHRGVPLSVGEEGPAGVETVSHPDPVPVLTIEGLRRHRFIVFEPPNLLSVNKRVSRPPTLSL